MTFAPADRDQWLGLVRSSPYATFFHTPHWHRLGLIALPGSREMSVTGRFSNGEDFVLPLLQSGRRWKGLFRILVSGAAGCYGGPIISGPVEENEVEGLVGEAARRMRAAPLEITSNPFAPFQVRTGSSQIDFTQLLPLTDRSYDQLFSRFSTNHRSSVRKGLKHGVTTRIADTPQDYRVYHEVYLDSLRRWGDRATSRYAAGFFDQVWQLASELPENVKLFLAEFEEKVVAGALVFCWNRHAVYWHGAALSDYFNTRAPLVLQAAIIEHCQSAGFDHYDFNPSGGHDGVVRFKEGFGAERREFTRTKHFSGPVARLVSGK